MISQEIPRHQWQEFCEQFSRQHHDWRVSLGVTNSAVNEEDPEAEGRILVVAAEMPLQDISIDRSGEEPRLTVSVGDRYDHVTHWVHQPRRVCFQQTDQGAHVGLIVDEETDRTTILRFRTPTAPETLDGLADWES
jgi:hypothetical protein